MDKVDRVDEHQGRIVHVYDDIEEADNRLPNWWLYTLFGSIIFGFFYWSTHHAFEVADMPEQAYQKAKAAQFANVKEVSDEYLAKMSSDPGAVADGKSLFTKICKTCHGDNGEGINGPNLTDDYWIHGGTPTSIYDTIYNGVPGKMEAWGRSLGQGPVIQATAYVLSIRGKDLPGRPPEGDKYDPTTSSQ